MGATKTWTTFCVVGPSSRNYIHFFPASDSGGTVPYQVDVKFTLFGNGREKKSLLLEGARVNQPDGVRIEDVFEELAGRSGVFGLEVELTASQSRANISESICIVEIRGPAHSVRFRAIESSAEGVEEDGVAAFGFRNANSATSMILVNSSDAVVSPEFTWQGKPHQFPPSVAGGCVLTLEDDVEGVTVKQPQKTSFSPNSVSEIDLEDCLFSDSAEHDCSWGTTRTGILGVVRNQPGIACYAVYRDSDTKSPVSVCGL